MIPNTLVQIITNIVFTAGGYILLSVGFNLLFKTRKFIDISYGSLIAIGGYAMLFFAKKILLPFYLALLLSCLVTIGVALLFDKLIYSTLRKKKASSLVSLIASLGVYTATTAIISMLFASQYQSLSLSNKIIIFQLWGSSFSLPNLLYIVLAVIGSIVVLYLLYWSRYGRILRAMDDDKEVAEISGIPTKTIITKTIIIAALFAAATGITVGYDIGLIPVIGMGYLLRTFIVCVMGGLGSIEGGIVSAFILSATENLTVFFISAAWKDPVVFLVFLIILLFKPQGLFYRPQTKTN